MQKITLSILFLFVTIAVAAFGSGKITDLVDEPCSVPENIVTYNVTVSGAEVAWDAPSTGWPDYYEYCIKTVLEEPNENDVISNTTSTGVSFTDLSENTNYYMYIRTHCTNPDTGDTGVSEWSNQISITTASSSCSFPVNMSSYNTTWYGTDLTWATTSDTSLFFKYCIKASDAPPTSADPAYATQPGQTSISTSENYGNLLPGTMYYVYMQTACLDNGLFWSEWSPASLFMTLENPCQAPSNIGISNITTVGADFSWDAPTSGSPDHYEYVIKTVMEAPTDDDTVYSTGVGETGFTSSDLTPYTMYFFYIRTICVDPDTGDTGYGDWSNANQFTTAYDGCYAPGNIVVSDITATSATISWDLPTDAPLFYQYCVVTDGIPTNGPTTADGTVTTVYTNITPGGYTLTPSTTYSVFVRSVCAGSQGLIWGTWSSETTFTTEDVFCSAPDNITVSNITTNSADFSWDAPTTGYPFFYQYCVVTDGIPVDGPTTAPGVTTVSTTDTGSYGDLLSNITYQVFVRTFCLNTDTGENSWSEWSLAVSFTTLFDETCNAPGTITVSNVTDTSADFSWDMPTTGYPFFYQYCLVTDGIPVEGPSTAPGVTTASTTDTGSYGDLLPDTTYNFFVRTFCLNTDTGETAWSEWSAVTSFTTEVMGLNNPFFKGLKVYPNPVSSELTITNSYTIEKIEVYDLLGNRVLSQNYDSNHIFINVNSLEKGVYLLSLSSHNTKSTLKLVKN